MNWIRRAGVILLGFVLPSQAARVSLPELGLSIYKPDGWEVSVLSADDSTRMAWMYRVLPGSAAVDTSRASFYFQAENGVSRLGERGWVNMAGLGQSLAIQGYTENTLFLDDSTLQDGLYAWRVYGRYAEEDQNHNFTGIYVDEYSRSFASGDIGWTISFVGDTADVDTSGPRYARILDSVTYDRSFKALPVGLAHPRSVQTRAQPLAKGLFVAGQERPRVEAWDVHGRRIEGRLEATAQGWWWTPQVRQRGYVAYRVEGSGRTETLRAVLNP